MVIDVNPGSHSFKSLLLVCKVLFETELSASRMPLTRSAMAFSRGSPFSVMEIKGLLKKNREGKYEVSRF